MTPGEAITVDLAEVAAAETIDEKTDGDSETLRQFFLILTCKMSKNGVHLASTFVLIVLIQLFLRERF